MSTPNPKKSNLDALRSALSSKLPGAQNLSAQTTPAPQLPKEALGHKPAVQRTEKRATAARRPAAAHGGTGKPGLPSRSGRGMQFYLDDSDRKIMRNLAVWFGSQDRRVSDSQIVKAAIRLAAAGHQNAKLLQIADDIHATDRRRVPKEAGRKRSKQT